MNRLGAVFDFESGVGPESLVAVGDCARSVDLGGVVCMAVVAGGWGVCAVGSEIIRLERNAFIFSGLRHRPCVLSTADDGVVLPNSSLDIPGVRSTSPWMCPKFDGCACFRCMIVLRRCVVRIAAYVIFTSGSTGRSRRVWRFRIAAIVESDGQQSDAGSSMF